MNAVRLKHGAVVGEALEHEWNQGNILLSSDLREQAFKPARIHRTVIRRNAHPCNHDFGALLAARFHDRDKIAPGFFKRIATQAVIAAKRDDDDCRSKFLKGACNAIAAAKRGFTADTGVHHLVIEVVAFDALLEQRDPAFALRQPIAGGNAVTENEYGLCSSKRYWNNNQHQKKKKQPHG